ncbi:FAD/NAD(P)-binding protein [Streptomyces sp. PTM05]|uniref:FAD/NAD(P)-binding protein n=1 Tax=Streptantibioticus parmotrematis TaxID=2873249 RepID=A0ABS7QLE6_9ACTN|nr:FAD/NAD(P)-binding protein [Streptantibioticus parmotrematis]
MAVIGAGPSGLSVLERICANVRSVGGDTRLRMHLVDPYVEAGGRVWHRDQPGRLWMNTVAGTVTMFTDATVDCEGPVRPGPTLHEWAVAQGTPLSEDSSLDPLVPETSRQRWASRRVMGEYLRWFLEHVEEQCPPGVTVERHATVAVEVTSRVARGRTTQLVRLQGRDEALECDYVVFAYGGPGSALTARQKRLRDAARSSGGSYVPAGTASVEAVAAVAAGEPVLMRGIGLTFYDYLQLLTTERGGRFVREKPGSLTYVPSGREPRIMVGSRRGVPHRPAPWPQLPLPRQCVVPRWPDADSLFAAARVSDPAAAVADIKRRVTYEAEYAYYFELFASHPDRVASAWDEFSVRLRQARAGGRARLAMVTAAVRSSEDVFDLERTTDPLREATFGDLGSLQTWMRRHVAASSRRSMSPDHSADRAALTALSRVSNLLVEMPRDGLRRESTEAVAGVRRWLASQIKYLAGGAPWPRQEELIALSRAGVVTFLGPIGEVTADGTGRLRCRSLCVPDTEIHFSSLVEARMPDPAAGTPVVSSTEAPVRLSTAACADGVSGGVVPAARAPKFRVSDAGQVLTPSGMPDPHWYAVGASAATPTHSSLPRVRMNSALLRRTDRIARSVLADLRRHQED